MQKCRIIRSVTTGTCTAGCESRSDVYIDTGMSFLLVETVVRGYHVYQVLWEPRVGETFIALHESGNGHDRHAMAIYRDSDAGVVVGHLPREIAKTCHYFTRHDGKISGRVTGRRIHSEEAGGMEIPCRLKFAGSSRNIRRLKQVLQDLDSPSVRILSSMPVP